MHIIIGIAAVFLALWVVVIWFQIGQRPEMRSVLDPNEMGIPLGCIGLVLFPLTVPAFLLGYLVRIFSATSTAYLDEVDPGHASRTAQRRADRAAMVRSAAAATGNAAKKAGGAASREVAKAQARARAGKVVSQLSEQLQAGAISQAEYDQRVAQVNDKLASDVAALESTS